MGWRIELLGGVRVTQGGREVAPFRRPRVASLFVYLAFYGHRPHPREELIELQWPEADPDVGRNNLRVTLHLLRQHLEEPDPPLDRLLLAAGDTIQFRPGAFTTDVAEFEAALCAARETGAHERAQRLAAAVALYRGELLPGFFEPWVLAERGRLGESYQEALQQLVGALEQAGHPEGALEYARRAVRVDPLREEAHYDLMRLHAAAGRPRAALRQYEELERLLREELEETPSAATRALAEELRESGRTVIAARRTRPEALPGARRPVPGARGSRPERPAAETESRLPSRHLPAQFTRFFGREEEIGRLTELLCMPETRLVTLTGPGGSGKTRLSIAVAGRLEEAFAGSAEDPSRSRSGPDPGPRRGPPATEGGWGRSGGPWFVPLAEVTEAQLIPEAIISALGLPRAAQIEPWAQVAAALQSPQARGSDAGPALSSPPGQRSLLVLDNFEQVVEAGAPLLRRLLEQVPTLTCLVTSRRRLELEGEQEFIVLPLPTPGVQALRRSGVQAFRPGTSPRKLGAGDGVREGPDPGLNAERLNAERLNALAQYPSVALFVDRARAARPDFVLTSENAAAVAQLCDRLEGLPLAIELAAARAAVLTPEQMLARLGGTHGAGGRFELLVSRRRDASSRHRSLRAAIEWSYQLLPSEMQLFFTQLSSFRGGWTVEAAEAICQCPGALEYLEELRHDSLIQVEEVGHPRGAAIRYRVLEMIREYGAEQLSPGERGSLAQRHAQFFLGLAEEAAPELRGAQHAEWLDRLEQEHDNFRAALDWCATTVVSDQWPVLSKGRYERTARPSIELATDHQPLATEAIGLRMAAALAPFWFTRGFIREGRARLTAAMARFAGRPEGAALDWITAVTPARTEIGLWNKALDGAGSLAVAQSDFETARAAYEQRLALSEQRDDSRGILETLFNLGVVAGCEGRLAVARSYYERSLTLARELNDRERTAQSLSGLGGIAELEGDYRRAGSFFEQSVPLAREVGARSCLVWALHAWGFVTWQQGDLDTGRALMEESMALFREMGHRYGLARSLERLAGLALAQRQTERAARLYGAAAKLRDEIGSPLGPLGQAELDRDVAAIRDVLGEPAFAHAWVEGGEMTLEQALECAQGRAEPPG